MCIRKTLSFSRKIIGNRVQKWKEKRLVSVLSSGALGQTIDSRLVPDGLSGLWDHHTVFLAVRTRTIEPTPPTARACGHTLKGTHQV